MNINFNNLLKSDFINMNPLDMLKQAGLTKNEIDNVMVGNMTPIIDSVQRKLDIIDFNAILKRFNKSVNKNLINYFYKKAKLKETFTEDEQEVYGNALNFCFDLVFNHCKLNTFNLSSDLKDTSLLIVKNNEYYQMSVFDDINQIIFLGDKAYQ